MESLIKEVPGKCTRVIYSTRFINKQFCAQETMMLTITVKGILNSIDGQIIISADTILHVGLLRSYISHWGFESL
jgi:hypothetical protein